MQHTSCWPENFLAVSPACSTRAGITFGGHPFAHPRTPIRGSRQTDPRTRGNQTGKIPDSNRHFDGAPFNNPFNMPFNRGNFLRVRYRAISGHSGRSTSHAPGGYAARKAKPGTMAGLFWCCGVTSPWQWSPTLAGTGKLRPCGYEPRRQFRRSLHKPRSI